MHRIPGALSLAILTAVVKAIDYFEKGDCRGLYVTVWGNAEPPSETYVLSSKTYTLAAQQTPYWGSSENDTDVYRHSSPPKIWDPKTLALPPGMTSFPCVFPPTPVSVTSTTPAAMQPPPPQKTTIRTTQVLPPHIPHPMPTSQLHQKVSDTTMPAVRPVTTDEINVLATTSPGQASPVVTPTTTPQLESSTLQNPVLLPLPPTSVYAPRPPDISTLVMVMVNPPPSSLEVLLPSAIIPSQKPVLLSSAFEPPLQTLALSLHPEPISSTIEAQIQVISSVVPLLSPPATSTLVLVGLPPSSLQISLRMPESILSQDPGLPLSTLVAPVRAMSSSQIPVPVSPSNAPEIQITSQMQVTSLIWSPPSTSSPVLAPASSANKDQIQVPSSVELIQITSSPLLESSQIQIGVQPSPTLVTPLDPILSSSLAASTSAAPIIASGSCDELNPCQDGLCCSQYGFCGSTIDFCGAGCQPNAGVCMILNRSSTLLEPIQSISSSQDRFDYIFTSTSLFSSSNFQMPPLSTSAPTVPSPSPSPPPAPAYQFPDCGPTIGSSPSIWDKLYTGSGYTENPINPGNPTNAAPVTSTSSSFTLEFSETYACYVVAQCIIFAQANSLVSIDVHLIHTTGDAGYWQCVGYPNDVGSGDYFTVADSTVLVAYGYDLQLT